MISPVRLVQLSIFLFSTHLVICKLEFTNIKCVTFDPEFAVFDYCFLKSVNCTYKYYSLKVKLLKTPVTNVKINIATLQRLNGYKPFLYNVTVDGCRFYKNQRSNPVFSYFFSFFKAYSNLNHSCPYDETRHHFGKVPHGDYLYRADWYAYNIKRATVDVFAKIY